jgi:hypothetical protein
MIVVADTTPLRYLVVIEREHLLPALYGRVLIPPAVAEELNHKSTPDVVRAWLASRPNWLEIRQPMHALPPEVDLDQGEREAIALDEELAADLLLIDEWDARLEAEAGICAWSGRCASLPTAPAAASRISKSLSIVCRTRTFASVQNSRSPCCGSTDCRQTEHYRV